MLDMPHNPIEQVWSKLKLFLKDFQCFNFWICDLLITFAAVDELDNKTDWVALKCYTKEHPENCNILFNCISLCVDVTESYSRQGLIGPVKCFHILLSCWDVQRIFLDHPWWFWKILQFSLHEPKASHDMVEKENCNRQLYKSFILRPQVCEKCKEAIFAQLHLCKSEQTQQLQQPENPE